MIKKENKEEYKKPEFISIDDPAFDEKGQGGSFFCPSDIGCEILGPCNGVVNVVCGRRITCPSVTFCPSRA